MKKIGILTFHNVINYGGVLQCMALQDFLKAYNYEVEVINYKSKHIGKNNKLIKFSSMSNLIKSVLTLPFNYIRKKRYNNFIKNNLILTNDVKNYDELKKLCEEKYDYVIIGSDQVWNSEITENEANVYFLENINVKKISYAASTGDDKINDINRIIKNSSDFEAISVREESTYNKLLSHNIKTELNVDPTLILRTEYWNTKTTVINNQNCLLLYILGKNDKIAQLSNFIRKEKKLEKIYTFSKQKFGIDGIKSIATSGPLEFLNYFKSSKYILTNSFHGTVFSIIYKKEFFVMLPAKRPERIISLLNKLGLENRIIYDVENLKEIIKEKIDYKNIDKKLEDERNKSLKYITKVIGGKIK